MSILKETDFPLGCNLMNYRNSVEHSFYSSKQLAFLDEELMYNKNYGILIPAIFIQWGAVKSMFKARWFVEFTSISECSL